MGLAEDYRRQSVWRDWPRALAMLPALQDRTVLDLGCGVGDLSNALAERGARVVGLDGNRELLDEARTRYAGAADFRYADLRQLPELGAVDGIWCSFTAAYFPDELVDRLHAWSVGLRSGGWIALTEVDNLFGHEPVHPETRALLGRYAFDALAAGRYDFRMGGKLESALKAAGFAVQRVELLADRELSFHGIAEPEVLEAWRARLQRMKLLHEFCGERYAAVRDDFLSCLQRPEHLSHCGVVFCLATKI